MSRCGLCGAPLGKRSQGRSYDQHKRFFAIADAALWQWPEAHPRQVHDIESCRKYLVMRAGWYREAHRVRAEGMDALKLGITLEAAFRAAGCFSIAGQQGDDVVVWCPKSIAYEAMSHDEACHIFGKVNDVVIPALFGCTGEELLERRSDEALDQPKEAPAYA